MQFDFFLFFFNKNAAKFNQEEINDLPDVQPTGRRASISEITCVPVKLRSPSWVVWVAVIRSERPKTHILVCGAAFPRFPQGDPRDPRQMLLQDWIGLFPAPKVARLLVSL